MRSDYKYVNNNWDDEYADTLTSRERLVYRSNILGDDQRITNTGGGNTSSKLMETDPLTAEQTEVLCIVHVSISIGFGVACWTPSFLYGRWHCRALQENEWV